MNKRRRWKAQQRRTIRRWIREKRLLDIRVQWTGRAYEPVIVGVRRPNTWDSVFQSLWFGRDAALWCDPGKGMTYTFTAERLGDRPDPPDPR